jgi:hypothetical protein
VVFESHQPDVGFFNHPKRSDLMLHIGSLDRFKGSFIGNPSVSRSKFVGGCPVGSGQAYTSWILDGQTTGTVSL